MPIQPSKDQQRVADFLGLAPGGPRQRTEPEPLGDMPVVSNIPELPILYQVQKDLLKLFDALGNLEHEIDRLEGAQEVDAHARRIRRQADFAYRSLRTWLKSHG